jgi:hypothetical protein
VRYKLLTEAEWTAFEDYPGPRGERVYLAGPMTGLPEYNYPAFDAGARALRHDGIPVHNPAEQHEGRTDLPRETYMRHALASVVKCSAVIVLPGWEKSHGAALELIAAQVSGIPAYGFYDFIGWLDGGSEPEEINVTREHDARHESAAEASGDVPPRASVLLEAKNLITGDRNNTYGPPTQDFSRTAGMLTALGFKHEGGPVVPHHVAMIIACVKLSRLTWSPNKRDNWTDLAGYAGCGYECTVEDDD